MSAREPSLNFPPNSRYHRTAVVRGTLADGVERAWLEQRFPPDPAVLAAAGVHPVKGGERLDNIAAETLGDPEQYWRLCDANRTLRPDELTETVGRRLRVPLPEGISGGSIV